MAAKATTVSNPVAWFEIYVNDMKRAKKFYESVFGVKLQPIGSAIDEVELWRFPGDRTRHGAPGALVKMNGYPVGNPGTIIYFHCDDCAVEEKRIVESGGRIQRSKTSIGESGYIVLAHDTEGNIFGLHSIR